VLGRHLHKMTRRILSISIIGLISMITAITWYAFAARNQTPVQIVSATINRDCAPWDGSAFTVSVPMQGKGITISIYQAPDLKLPATFVFPDDTLSVGNALLILPMGSPEPLTGEVSFQRVAQDIPVEGQFDLVTEAGEHFKGKFIAEWGNEIIYCG
jgi:hypothetical protein